MRYQSSKQCFEVVNRTVRQDYLMVLRDSGDNQESTDVSHVQVDNRIASPPGERVKCFDQSLANGVAVGTRK